MTALGDRIRTVRFMPTRLHEGYDMGEVDEVLDRLAVMADEGEDLTALALGVDFTSGRLRVGYDAEEVDAFLTAVAKGTALREIPLPPTVPPRRLRTRSD